MKPEEVEDLKTKIMNRLQDKANGETEEQLEKLFDKQKSQILVALYILKNQNCVSMKDGVWTMVRS